MKSATSTPVVVCLVAACAPGLLLGRAAQAAPPGGTYEIVVGGASEIWVPDGDDQFCAQQDGDNICVSTSAATDGTGAVGGSGLLTLAFPELIDANLPFTFAGRLGGSSKSPVPKLTVAGMGSAVFHDPQLPDLPASLTGSGVLACRNPLPHGPEFSCKGKLRLCFTALGETKCSKLPIFALVKATGGPWTLGLELVNDGLGTVEGSATATLANTQTADYLVIGRYTAKNDQSKLVIAPTDPTSRDKLSLSRLVVDETGVQGGTVKFKVAGVKGAAVILPPP